MEKPSFARPHAASCRKPKRWLPGLAVAGFVCLGIATSSVSGCSGDSSAGAHADADAGRDAAIPDLASPPDLAGSTTFRFVMNTLKLPDSADETTKYLYDVDGNGTKENRLVTVMDALKLASAASLQPVLDDALGAGGILQLLALVSFDPALMNDPSIFVSGYKGSLGDGGGGGDGGAALYTGHARFDLDLTDEPPEHTLSGALVSGRGNTLHLPPGAFPIRFPLQYVAPIPLTVYGAYVHFQVASGGDGGGFTLGSGASDGGTTIPATLNGGLSQTQINGRLIPGIAQMLQAMVAKDPKSASAMSLLKTFDANKDGMITADEVANNALVAGILAPDLDLFDASGSYAPNKDHVNDSLSFGVAFTAVGALFADPPAL